MFPILFGEEIRNISHQFIPRSQRADDRHNHHEGADHAAGNPETLLDFLDSHAMIHGFLYSEPQIGDKGWVWFYGL